MPHTSIVMPAFNAARYLAEAVASLQAQTFDDWELIIVDDGSTDTTLEMANSVALGDSRIRVIQQANAGPAATRNTGVSHSTQSSPTFLFLDADDVLLPGALASLRAALSDHPDAGAVHGLAEFVNAEGQRIRQGESSRWTYARRLKVDGWLTRQLGVGEPLGFRSLLCCNSIQTPGTALVRRQALMEAEGFDPDIRITEDWDLWIRLAERLPVYLVPELVLEYRLHEDSFSASLPALRAAEAMVRRKTLNRLTARERREAVHAIKAYERTLALSKAPLTLASLRRGNFRDGVAQVAFGARHLVRSLPGTPIGTLEAR